jgi:prepilin-type N-terminal cleavage/methylation domain-containing protein
MTTDLSPSPSGDKTTAARTRSKRDGGYSLPEILVSLVLMGTLMSAVMAGMFTIINASTISDNEAELDAVLGAAADALGDTLFEACPDNGDENAYLQFAQTGALAVGWPAESVQIEKTLYWDPYADDWSISSGLTLGQCDAAVWLSSAKTMQKLVIVATTPDQVDSRRLEVVITDIRPAES